MSIKEIIAYVRSQSVLMRIIYANGAIWIALRLAVIVGLFIGVDLKDAALSLVEMPSWLPGLLSRPWTPLTYMFSQYDVLHVLFNMLWLYWFGIIFMSLGRGSRLLALYIAGGLGGALLYVLAYNLLPGFSHVRGLLIGSSASVIAIVTATAIIAPGYRMHLLFLGAVKLKWVAIVTIGLDLLSVSGANAGGHIAHLGGAVVGAVYAWQLRRGGFDITAPFAAAGHWLSRQWRRLTRPPRKGASGSPKASAGDRAQLDAILDKLKRSGYASLTPEERRRLFDISNRIK